MLIVVKQLKGREVECQLPENGSVADLKLAIDRQLNVAGDDQRLVFKGKILQDSLPLSEYGLCDGSRVHLTAKTTAPSVGRLASKADSVSVDQSRELDADGISVTSVDHLANLRRFLLRYFTSEDADKVVKKFREEIELRVGAMNLDEIERLAKKRTASTREGQ